MLKKFIVCLVVMVALVGMAASSPVFAQNVAVTNLANFRVVNALVGMGTVDVYIDGNLVAYALRPETATPYLVLPAGKHNVAVFPTGADPLSTPVAQTLVAINPNHSRTGVVYQTRFATLASRPSVEGSGTIVVIDDDRSPIQLGRTRLTALHLAPGTPQPLSIGYPSRASLLHEIHLERPYGSVDMDAGVKSLAIVDASSPTLDILSRVGDVSFYGDTYYTFIIIPDMPPPPDDTFTVGRLVTKPRLFVVSAPMETPPDGVRMRIVHAAHDTAVLDVYIDERLVASRVNYGLATQYLGLTPYSHTIALRPFGASPDSPPIARADFTISQANLDQKNWSLMLLNATSDNTIGLPITEPVVNTNVEGIPNTLINTRGGPMIMTIIPDDISQTRRGYSRMRLVHALDGFPELSIYTPRAVSPVPLTPEAEATSEPLATPLQLVEQAVFGIEAGEAEVPSGFYPQLDIRIALTNNTIATLEDTYLVEGLVYTFVVIGSNSGEPPLQVLKFADYGTGVSVNVLYSGRVRGLLVNVRAEPRDTASVTNLLPRDTDVVVLGRNGSADWIRIRFNDPESGSIQEGWIFADLISIFRLGVPVNARTLPEYTRIGS